jgi:hypothetical protein
VPNPDREEREIQLAALEALGITPVGIWLRLLDEEGLDYGDASLMAIVQRHGGEAEAVLATWYDELLTATGGARDRTATAVALREGPRLALLLIPPDAYARAMAPYGAALSERRAPRCRLLRRRTA